MSVPTQIRRQQIVEQLRSAGFASVAALAELFDVSEVTIRSDLSALERDKTVVRTHGGAMLEPSRSEPAAFRERTQINADQKRRIAQYTAELIDDHESLLLDASTTAFFLAEQLDNHQGLTIFTNGIDVAMRLARCPAHRVFLTGGLLRRETGSLGSGFGIRLLDGLRVRKAVLSCTGLTPTFDLTDDDLFEVEMKRAMVHAADRVLVVLDSSKFEHHGLATFASISHVSRLITDDGLSSTARERLSHAQVAFTICGPQAVNVYEAGTPNYRPRIAYANQDDRAPFAALVRHGLVQAAQQHNVDLLLLDNASDGATALANIDYIVHEQLDLLIEFNNDAAIGNVIMDRLRQAKIPVIALDIPLPGATFFGVDNYRAGRMAGRLLGQYVRQQWASQLDRLIMLELPISGPTPAARMQGQLDGLREVVDISDAALLRLDSKNNERDAYHAVSQIWADLQPAERIGICGINDETVLGALALFAERNDLARVAAVAFGAGPDALRELQHPGSRLVGAVASFPEHYGEALIALAQQIIKGQQVPPAVYTTHRYVLPDTTPISATDLGEAPLAATDYAAQLLSRRLPDTPRSLASSERVS
jgi:ribose transport system substrate-binding protein